MAFYELAQGAANPLAAGWHGHAGLTVAYTWAGTGQEMTILSGATFNSKLRHTAGFWDFPLNIFWLKVFYMQLLKQNKTPLKKKKETTPGNIL